MGADIPLEIGSCCHVEAQSSIMLSVVFVLLCHEVNLTLKIWANCFVTFLVKIHAHELLVLVRMTVEPLLVSEVVWLASSITCELLLS